MLYRDWEKASSVAEHLPVGILQIDTEGHCLALNTRAALLLRLPPQKALGSGWLEVLDPESRRAASRHLLECSRGDSPLRLELRLPSEGGDFWVLSCRLVPLRSDEGELRGFLMTLLDVTEWHRTARDLRRTTKELEARVRELDCLFEISRAVERHAGDLDEILKETVSILAHTWSRSGEVCVRITLDGRSYQTSNFASCPQARRAAIFLQGEPAGEIEVGVLGSVSMPDTPRFRPEDEERLLTAVAQRLGRTAERVKGRQLLQEKEEEMRARLTHLTRVSTLGEMASSIAHEVNQPLTAIAAYAQACRRMVEGGQAGQDDILEILARINDEALRAGAIVHRLKDMVRRRDARWTECDVNALVRDIQPLAVVDARLHNVRLHFEFQPDLPPVLADGVQIQQVVLNLIRNAIDAVEETARKDGEVTVRTGLAGAKEIQISVTDNGCGLPEGLDARLFQPFFTTKKGGMGMGLSICKSIASAHGGRILFSRNPGAGMTFRLILPVLDGP